MKSRCCPVRTYNKEKPDKFCVDIFIMVDSKICFSYHLYVYQGKNQENMAINPRENCLPTTQKYLSNAILKAQI